MRTTLAASVPPPPPRRPQGAPASLWTLVAACLACPFQVEAGKIHYTYDRAGRLVAENFGGLKQTQYTHDANGNLLSRVTGGAPPLIDAPPAGQAATAGDAVTLSVSILGPGPFTYQWRRDGFEIPGATGATYELPSAQGFHAGEYTVRVSNAFGMTSTRAATLSVAAPTGNDALIANLSTRAVSLTGADVLIPGFVVTGAASKRLLMRVVGPTLGGFGVAGVLADPRLQLKRQEGDSSVDVAANDDWEANANAAEIAALTTALGAFDLAPGSADAALLLELAPGNYTIVADSATGGTGVVLVEIYDADAYSADSTGSPESGSGQAGGGSVELVNISSRTFVGTAAQVPIPGFVISGNDPRTVLVRAIGPTLGTFGVQGTLPDPRLEIFSGGAALFGNDDWSTDANPADTAAAALQVGAFALPAGSKDAAMVVTLAPGPYTVVVSDATGATGVVLVEVYLVP